jgi:hypothetical protein
LLYNGLSFKKNPIIDGLNGNPTITMRGDNLVCDIFSFLWTCLFNHQLYILLKRAECLFHGKVVEYDILRVLKVVLDRTLVRDDQHGWRTCMEEVAMASDEAGIIYGSTPRGADFFVDHEVFCRKSLHNLLDK